MKILPTSIHGCFQLQPAVMRDDRGSFVKVFHEGLFRDLGLATDFAEEYYSWSRRGVLRGMHFQTPPSQHSKLVYCPQGEVLDAALDMRHGSPTYGQHLTLTLSGENGNMLYLPPGVAHGFYTLSEQALMVYKVTSVYSAANDTGVLWSSTGIDWGVTDPVISLRDSQMTPLADFDSPFVFDGGQP
jgi:dTDP-4-dehydrorhamnose 3,5-epimerase